VILIFKRFVVTLVGSLLLGIGVNGFLVPNHFIDGGVLGIALILHYLFQFQTGMTMIALSLPICLYASMNERGYFLNSIQGLFVSSLFIDLLSPLQNQFFISDILSAILGGILIGIGVGLMLRYKSSTGGTDLLAKMISRVTSMHLGLVIILIDGLIVLAGFAFLEFKQFLGSCLAIVTIGLTTSFIESQ
jgi:uncharacterized membrane-anchored protein YitT (DUF2179 family)